MSDLKHISPENKERLVQLVNKTASYVNGGMEPTDALVKAAGEGDYPSDYVLRAAEAYNGAAHLAYFKSAGLDDRGNSFALADGPGAVARILNSADVSNKKAEKTSFSYLAESNGYFDTTEDDSFLFVEKQATAPSFDAMSKAAAALDKQEKLAIETNRNRYNQACESLAKSITHFKEKTANATSYRKTHWAREMLERHGKQALDVISLATGITGEECTKLAADKIGYFSLGNDELNSLDSIVQGFNQVKLLNTKLAQAEHDAYVNRIERNNLLNQACGISPVAKKESASFDLTGHLGTIAGQLSPGIDTPSESIQKGILETLADPDFVDQSSRIDRALTLHKLMKSDPIIGSRPPNEIEQALSEINSIAPTATRSEPLLRSMLRRRLEAGEQIDDFSLNQMLAMEDRMREQHREYSVVPKLTGLTESAGKGK